MFTFPGSFLNAGYGTDQGIGHLFHDKHLPVGEKYLETLQHDDSVLFTFVHESREQRYGYDQFRKIVHVDLPTDAVARIVEHLDGDLNPLNRTLTLTDEDGNDIGFCRYTHDHLGVGTLLNGRLMVIDLDGDAIFSLVNLLHAYVRDYDDYISNQVDVTKPAHEWEAIAAALDAGYDQHIAAIIREELYGRHPQDKVNVRLRDERMAETVEEHANVEVTACAGEWLDVCAEAKASRHFDVIEHIVNETDLKPYSSDPYPYGVLPTTPLTASIPLTMIGKVNLMLGYVRLDSVIVFK